MSIHDPVPEKAPPFPIEYQIESWWETGCVLIGGLETSAYDCTGLRSMLDDLKDVMLASLDAAGAQVLGVVRDDRR